MTGGHLHMYDEQPCGTTIEQGRLPFPIRILRCARRRPDPEEVSWCCRSSRYRIFPYMRTKHLTHIARLHAHGGTELVLDRYTRGLSRGHEGRARALKGGPSDDSDDSDDADYANGGTVLRRRFGPLPL